MKRRCGAAGELFIKARITNRFFPDSGSYVFGEAAVRACLENAARQAANGKSQTLNH